MKPNLILAFAVGSILSASSFALAGPGDHHPPASTQPAGNEDSGHSHKHLKYDELPEPVRKTVDAARGQAELEHIFVTKTKQGSDVYVVEFELDDAEHQLATLGDGSVFKHEQTVTIESLPEEVRKSVLAASGSATIDLLEKISRPASKSNPLYYEAKFTVDDVHHTLRVSPEGLVIEHSKE